MSSTFFTFFTETEISILVESYVYRICISPYRLTLKIMNFKTYGNTLVRISRDGSYEKEKG